ncbi:AMP-binding protein [Mycobacterium sp. OTB74]|jgi:bile acid-coenzyme A ligase|uniref:class I adenylate-forming enzyme family protein n=1 Tax=Mycobacterium sp. OTB74 TaxID=1853452 RepID=UPI0024758480|nr:AMP-binding protein [Mycobacterium sp. OTB74]MDH6246754.1 bile acid-coenzyme A ligase [Mycobacterium sp. OTB74]
MTSCPDGVPFGTQLTARAQADPDGIALTLVRTDGSERTLTWNSLECNANQWARALAERAVGVGDLVALSVPNSVELILGALAAWKVGAIPIPMRWDLPEWEQQRLLAVIDAKLVIDSGTADAVAREASRHDDAALPEVTSPALNGICSSGSTGLPKIILNTSPALWSPAKSTPFMTHWAPVSTPQTILVPAPMYHTNGFNPLTYLLGGDRLVVLEKFDAATVLDVIERHRVTHFTATPTMLSRIADRPDVDQRDLSSVEWIMQGAAVMPPTLLRRWFDLLSPQRVVMAYGMTENLGLTTLRGDEWLDHPGSVGRGFRDTELRILDPDGSPCPPGEIGEIYLRAAMSDGYRYLGGAPPLPTTADGFTSAGDLGHLDADGFLYIADRRTDMIVTGGANVFPAEVETALIDHPAVADVVVIGLADAHWGRRVHAVVQPTEPADPPDAQDVIAFAKARLAGYKVPKTVEYIDEIPRTAATKVNRSAMVAARGG